MVNASGDNALLARQQDTVRVPLREWRFGGRFMPGSTAPDFDDSGFAAVTVPHCVVDLPWHEWDPATWSAQWIYRTTFARPAAGRVFLDFDGVLSASTVTVNGHEFDRHLGGYLPVSYEITEHLRDTDNVVAVVVDGTWLDVPPDGAPKGPAAVDYQQPAGIYRAVTLRCEPQTFVSDVFAKPIDVLSDDRALEVRCTVDGEIDDAQLEIALRDGARTLASTTVDSRQSSVTLRNLGDVELWDIDAPRLYDVVVTLRVGGAAVHETTRRTGFREARFEPDGFFLNGRRLKLFGLNRHQSYPYVGMAMPDRVQRRDAEILKHDLNCNIVRCAHYPQSPAFLDACDELGLMVWEEPPGWQFVGDEAWQELLVRDVRDMIVRDRNRPSIVVWGVQVNESARYPDLYGRTKKIAYELDGTRATSGSLTQHFTDDWDQDVFAFDDYHSDGDDAALRPPIDGVPYLVAESVGALTGPHFYRWTDDTETLARQAFLHAQVHDTVAGDDRYSGLIAWLGFDYASEHGYTYKNMKTPGVGDIFRNGKPGTTFYRSQVDVAKRAVVEPAFGWDGAAIPGAIVGTNCERLEIRLGGEHVLTTSPDIERFGNLRYPPHFLDLPAVAAELRIDGYVGDECVVSRRMAADRTGDRFVLEVDDAALVADGVDATRVVFRIVDRYGNRRAGAAGTVHFSLDGPATLIGENPFDLTDTPGGAAVWLKSRPGIDGTVTLTASHSTMGTATATVDVARS